MGRAVIERTVLSFFFSQENQFFAFFFLKKKKRKKKEKKVKIKQTNKQTKITTEREENKQFACWF